MESIALFYDNALIYSPNLFFISLILLLTLSAFLIGNFFSIFVKSIQYSTEYIFETQKRKKKKKNNRFNILLDKILVTYKIINKKNAIVILRLKKIRNAIKEEVFIKEGEQQ